MLFDTSLSESKNNSGATVSENSENTVAFARKFKLFKSIINDFQEGQNVHFFTGGNWSLHELLEYLFTITGPADLYFSTWAIREEPVRALIDLMQKGIAKSIHCLLDHRVESRDPNLLHFIHENFTSVRFAPNHAKVSVIQNDKFSIVINGSQNHTKNPRIESGIISWSKPVADFHIKWIRDEQ